MKPLQLRSDHWLAPWEGVTHQASPNTGGAFAEGQPDTLVIHYTGGRSAESSARWLCDPRAKASAHVIIGRDGSVIQLVDFQTVAWHAGRSSWAGRSGLNRYSLGIELDNAGPLEARAAGYYTWFGRLVPEDEVLQATHRHATTPNYWHTYTEAQLARCEELCELLINTYRLHTLVGHEEISPGRKTDPGPAFPLEALRQRLLAGDRSEEAPALSMETPTQQGLVVADRLNIRQQPHLQSPTVTDALPRGTLVSIEAEQGGWAKVRVETEGWVKKEYLKTS